MQPTFVLFGFFFFGIILTCDMARSGCTSSTNDTLFELIDSSLLASLPAGNFRKDDFNCFA